MIIKLNYRDWSDIVPYIYIYIYICCRLDDNLWPDDKTSKMADTNSGKDHILPHKSINIVKFSPKAKTVVIATTTRQHGVTHHRVSQWHGSLMQVCKWRWPVTPADWTSDVLIQSIKAQTSHWLSAFLCLRPPKLSKTKLTKIFLSAPPRWRLYIANVTPS